MANLKPYSGLFMRLILVIFLLPLFALAQGNKTDSLLTRLKQNLPDTERVQILMKLGKINLSQDIDKAAEYLIEAVGISQSINDKKNTAKAYNLLGSAYLNQGKNDSALICYQKGYQYASEARDTATMIYSEMNTGTVYFVTNSYNMALEYFFRALTDAEKVNSLVNLSRSLGNIGNVYKEQGKLKEALEYYKKSRVYVMQVGGAGRLATNYVNSGNIYYDMFRQNRKSVYLDSAYYLYSLGESTLLAEPDSSILAMLYSNLGNVFAEKKQYTQAVNLYERSLDMKFKIGEEAQIAVLYENLASCYLEMNLPDKAEGYIKEGLKEAEGSDSYEDMSALYRDYSDFYRKKNNYTKAYEYYVLYKQYADSVLNDENIERRKELEMNYSFDKEREQNLLEQKEKEVLRNEEKKRSAIYISVTVVGLIITLVIALIIFRNFKLMKKAHGIISAQKNQIEKQKELVEEKQKEILDSIKYARRIQSSLLPSDKYVEKHLKKLKV